MKILVIRFSSIGDIVLTTPVVRVLKTQLDEAEVHYVTKQQYKSIVESNPYIDKVFTLDTDLNELVNQLKQEKYDYIIDLHNNHFSTFSLRKLKDFTPNFHFKIRVLRLL